MRGTFVEKMPQVAKGVIPLSLEGEIKIIILAGANFPIPFGGGGSNTTMKQLHRLIHSLTEHEWKTLLNFLAFFPNKNEPWKKIFGLAKLIRKTEDENTAAKIYSVKLYGKQKESALIRTGQMLRNKILECLTLDVNIADTISKDDGDYVLIQLKKKAAQYHSIKFTNPNTAIAQDLLDEIIKQAKEYKFFKILVEHLKFKKSYCLSLGSKEYEKLCSEIEFYEKCENEEYVANDYLYRLQLLDHHHKNHNKISFLENAIGNLKTNYGVCKSKFILYILKQLEQEYYIAIKDYEKAKNACLETHNIIRNNKVIYKKQRMGISYAHLSNCSIYLNKFSETIDYARKSLEYFPKDSANYMCSKEAEFYGLFYHSNYKEAAECVKYILNNSVRKELGELRYAQFNYLLANAWFKQNKYDQVLNILNNERELSKDKAGWEIGLRILRIKTNIEIAKFDDAGKQTEQLRKFIAYNEKKMLSARKEEKNKDRGQIRNKIISKLLSLAEKNGFIFSNLNGKTNEYLSELKNGKECAWEYFSPELIPFHEWYEEKMRE
jgi:hypothetical protein